MPPGCPMVLSLIHVLSQVDGAVFKVFILSQWPSPRAQQYKAGHLAPWLSSAQCTATSEKPLPSFDPFWSYWPTESRSDSNQSLASYFYQATVSEDSSTKKILRMGKCKHALVLLAKYTLKFILAKQMWHTKPDWIALSALKATCDDFQFAVTVCIILGPDCTAY